MVIARRLTLFRNVPFESGVPGSNYTERCRVPTARSFRNCSGDEDQERSERNRQMLLLDTITENADSRCKINVLCSLHSVDLSFIAGLQYLS